MIEQRKFKLRAKQLKGRRQKILPVNRWLYTHTHTQDGEC